MSLHELQLGDEVPEIRLIELLPPIEDIPSKSLDTLGELLGVSGEALFATPASAVFGREEEFARAFVWACLDLAVKREKPGFLEQPLRRAIPLLDHVSRGVLVGSIESTPSRSDLCRSSFLEIKGLLKRFPEAERALGVLLADVLVVGSSVASPFGSLRVMGLSERTYLAAAAGSVLASARSAALCLEAPLALLAAWGYYEQGVVDAAELVARLSRISGPDDEIADAWRYVREFSLADLGASRRDEFDPTVGLARLMQTLPERHQLILRERTLSIERGRTLEALAQTLDCTRERVRQLETDALSRLADEIESPASAAVRRAGRNLRACIAAAAPLDVLDSTRAQAALDQSAAPDSRLEALILLYLAGPYEVYGGWIVRKPAQQVVAATVTALEAVSEGGYPTVGEALSALMITGIREDDAREWLASMPSVRVLDDYVVPWRGTLADKAEIVLRVFGRPLDFDEIVAAVAGDFNARTLRNYLHGDPRFRRLGLRVFGLDEWGGEEYTKISDEIAQEIERRGGEASLDDLTETLTSQFGVTANSVKAYATGPQFERSHDGLICLRSNHAQVPTQPVEFTRRCFRVQGQWSYRITVTHDTLRGSGSSIPKGFAGYLRLAHGQEVELEAPELQLRFTWPSLLPCVGSLRPAVDALGAGEGDYLFLASDPEKGTASITKVTKREIDSAACGADRLLLEVGIVSRVDDPLAAISDALGLPAAGASWAAVRRRLRARGEEDLLALLPKLDSGDESGLDDLMALVGV